MFLAYATPRGRALVDRRLYLPEHSWRADQGRCRSAGVPDETAFATEPALAAQMIAAALDTEGLPRSTPKICVRDSRHLLLSGLVFLAS
ncbi:DDE superfamily endonuclease [Microbispora rosea]|uniref:DDE superfamily endonuclease n=1 Tax=Microbispora rosea TaxID=58117 RepID=A0A1N7CJ47_9ACTN|nr:hypothetical protein Mro03_15020 [Microbispora rosea subsp. rosea]SIR63646.1 DDE superfamily endonuclease [Microbispora rosea]